MTSAHQTVAAVCRTHNGEHGPCALRVEQVDGLFVLDTHIVGTCGISLDRPNAAGFLSWLTDTAPDQDILLDPHLAMHPRPPGAGCVVVLDAAARVRVCDLLAAWLRGERP